VRLQVLMDAVMKMTAFWDTGPCSLVYVDRRFRGAYHFHHPAIALMMEVSTSETSVNFYETIRRSIPEICHLQMLLWWLNQGNFLFHIGCGIWQADLILASLGRACYTKVVNKQNPHFARTKGGETCTNHLNTQQCMKLNSWLQSYNIYGHAS
jgi:hypothetical protein